MRLLLLALYIALLIHPAEAQQLVTVSNTSVEKKFIADLRDASLSLELRTKITNTSNQNISLKWNRTVINQPFEWETQVCDKNSCYLPAFNTNYDPAAGILVPVTLAPGASFDLLLHIFPNRTAGTGVFDIDISLTGKPETTISTVSFSTVVESISATTEVTNKTELKIFPNPAIDYFELVNNNLVDKVVIYNLIGRKIRTFDASNGRRYNISDIPSGIYLVGLLDEQNNLLKTLRLSKKTLRP
ncbi:MAG: T9SS type A sorting domain-containing protein [Saprospiraceae bacterium]|nr:T9SS type A sorting domain-containing protein [Saprospiraceae bacterium]